MKLRPAFLPLAFVILCISFGTSCRAAHIHEMEQRIDKLEARVSVLEAKADMNARK